MATQAPGSVKPFDPVALTASDDPYTTWRDLRRAHPAFYSADHDAWFVTRHADVLAALKNPSRFSSRDSLVPMAEFPPEVKAILEDGWSRTELMRRNFINLDPPAHTPIRRVVNRAFARGVIRDSDAAIRAAAESLVDGFAADGRVELVSRFAYPFPAMVVFDLMGIPRDDLERQLRWGQYYAMLLGASGPLEEMIEAARGFVASQEYWEAALEDRRVNPRDDLLTALVQELAVDPSVDITLREMTVTVMGTATAGHSTTAATICFALELLLAHPDQLELLRADPTRMDNAIEEILRHDPALQMIRRTATEDIAIDGVVIPKGATVMLACAAGNHDESHFGADPDGFDIGRSCAKDHTTFGKGAHFCPGAPLARREVAIALDVLLHRLPNLRLAEQPGRMRHFWHRGYERLELAWDPAA